MEPLILSKADVMNILPDRASDTHKGDFGRLLLLCGSKGYTGAAALSAMGALRSGAGFVYFGVPDSIYPIVAMKLTEPVVFPLKDSDGMLSVDAIPEIEAMLARMDAVLIGPGLGQSEGTLAVVKYILEHFTGPVVLDADGINVVKSHINVLRGRTNITIVTPHDGEFLRLGGTFSDNRATDAMKLSQDLGVILVLKGNRTVITDGTYCYMNTTGNPGMAVGGSGDVLAGIIVGLLGQKISPLKAAACAVWLHGAAGDLCAEQIGQYGMLPSDMLHILPRLLK